MNSSLWISLTPTFRSRSLTIFNAEILAEGVIGLDWVILLGGVVVDELFNMFVLFFSLSIVSWFFLGVFIDWFPPSAVSVGLTGVTFMVDVIDVTVDGVFAGDSLKDAWRLSLSDVCLCRVVSARSAFKSEIKTNCNGYKI